MPPPAAATSIRHKVIVMSGKGGVGKSTVAANLAISLALEGHRVGLMDVDLHGPSIPKMLHIEEAAVHAVGDRIAPVEFAGVKVMSIGLLLRDADAPVIWRGPLKYGAIKQFLEEVEWGELDFLIIDAPPGTGDEPLSVCQLAAPLSGAVIVTTPQAVATADVRRSVTFCRQLELPVLGLVENMSGFACPHCQTVTAIFSQGGGAELAREMDIPFLGAIPLDPAVGVACDAGQPFVYHYNKSATAKAFAAVAQPLLALCRPPAAPQEGTQEPAVAGSAEENAMPQPLKIAVPTAEGRLAAHFGHTAEFTIFTVDRAQGRVLERQNLTPPPHEPGVLPRWLKGEGAGVVVAGGMGQRAQDLFAAEGIEVVVGAPAVAAEEVVAAYLAGTLERGENLCDH